MRQRPHLSRALLHDYFLGQAAPHDLVLEVARLLEAECDGCEAALADAGPDYPRAVREASRRAQAGLAELEAARTHLPSLLQELAESETEALLQVAADGRFHTVAFVEYEVSAAWAAVEGEEWATVRQATDLASAAAARLDVSRYGRIVVGSLLAEAELAGARVAIASGADGEARHALQAAEIAGALEVSGDLEAGIRAGRAVLAIREGDTRAARRHLDAGGAPRGGSAGRWAWSVEILLAVLERRSGRPDAAAGRLGRLVGTGHPGVPGPAGWRAARELIASLVAASRAEEAAALTARWAGDLAASPSRGARADREAAELADLRGRALRGLGQMEEASRALWRALGGFVALGLGLRATAAVGELARMAPEGSAPAGAATRLARALEELIGRCELPSEAMELLARFAGALERGTLAAEDVDDLEDGLVAVDPPWGPFQHATR